MVWRGESGWVDAGFHTEGGGGLEFPPPRNLEIEYGYYCGAINISYHVTGHKYVSSNLVAHHNTIF